MCTSGVDLGHVCRLCGKPLLSCWDDGPAVSWHMNAADALAQQADFIESRNRILDDLRQILIQKGDDREVLRQARVALSDWFVATYPHLYPGQGRPQFRVIQGGGEGTDRLF